VNFDKNTKDLESFFASATLHDFAKTNGHEQKTHDIELVKYFKPEILNRIDEIIIFRGLSSEDIHKIIYLEIENLEKRLLEMNFKLKISKEAVEYLAKQGYDEAYGARPIARAIQHYVEDAVADEILNGNIKEGETITIGFEVEKEQITIKSNKTKTK
jgi:ATP-dependent Clp protease ATP-binding subunit ClpC